MHLYGLKTCDTCRKALKSLPDATFHDVRTGGVPTALLRQAHETFGARLLNTRSTTWRDLSAQEREHPPLVLLETYPTLMKRPLIVAGDRLLLGWDKTTRAALGVAG